MSKKIDTVNHLGGTAGQEVLELVHSLMHEYRAIQYRALRDGPLLLTHMDGKTLDYFAHHPDTTQSEFAVHIGRDKAQVARLIKPLCEKGLLLRSTDEWDRRSVRLSVSAEGNAVLRSLKAQSRRLGNRAIAEMTQSEVSQLKSLLSRVRSNLGSA